MGWRPKNLNESLFPLQTLNAILGFHTFQYPLGRPRLFISVIYAICFTPLYYVIFGYTTKHVMGEPWFKFEEITFLSVLVVNTVIAGLAQILSWYHMKRRSGFMKKMMMVDETLKELGLTLDYIKFMNYGIGVIIYWLLTILIVDIVGTFWFTSSVTFSEIIIIISILQHGVHINSIVSLNFILALRMIEIRFCKANELLEENTKIFYERPFVYSWFSRNKVNDAFDMSNRRISRRAEIRKNIVQTIKHVHLELVEIAGGIEHSYGVQILLEMSAFFVLLTGLSYTLYTIIVNPSTDRILIRSIVIITWLVIYSLKLMIINYSCERVTAEAHKTMELIHCIDAAEDSECLDEIRQFSFQLMHNPLCFSPAGFFTLGFQFVQGFLGSVVTYLVILVQMGSLTTESKGR